MDGYQLWKPQLLGFWGLDSEIQEVVTCSQLSGHWPGYTHMGMSWTWTDCQLLELTYTEHQGSSVYDNYRKLSVAGVVTCLAPMGHPLLCPRWSAWTALGCFPALVLLGWVAMKRYWQEMGSVGWDRSWVQLSLLCWWPPALLSFVPFLNPDCSPGCSPSSPNLTVPPVFCWDLGWQSLHWWLRDGTCDEEDDC